MLAGARAFRDLQSMSKSACLTALILHTNSRTLSRFLWRRRRLATLRGNWMYFYTELPKGNGLRGVNVNTGVAERAVRLSDPDERFISDEAANLLYSSRITSSLLRLMSGNRKGNSVLVPCPCSVRHSLVAM